MSGPDGLLFAQVGERTRFRYYFQASRVSNFTIVILSYALIALYNAHRS